MAMDWEALLEMAPEKPGVYLMKDQEGEIIYIGKAISLRNRLRSYAQLGRSTSPKTRIMVSRVHSAEYIVTDTEIEALILESNLIKKHKPRYNITLKDDKHFPFIQVTVHEGYPRIIKARKMKKDNDRYFGPFTDAGAVVETLDLIRSVFKLRDCKNDLDKDPPGRPCLNYHIKRCPAPCQNFITKEEYGQTVSDALLFLEGRQEDLMRILKEEMKKAAADLAYEKAARLRDRIQAVEKITARQKISASLTDERDIIAMTQGEKRSCIQVFYMREGKMMGRDQHRIDDTDGMTPEEILTGFVKQYYSTVPQIPREVVVPVRLDDADLIADWLSQRRGSKVTITVPQRGKKKDLLSMAEKNTQLALDDWDQKDLRSYDMTLGALEKLQGHLELSHIPQRIECYDISNIQGREPVGSMVVFLGGQPSKKDYRRFQIRLAKGPDDFAMMHEVLTRRFSKPTGAKSGEQDSSFAAIPDLIVVDGGKGQVSAARKALEDKGYGQIPLIGLAKEREEIFLSGNPDPLVLPHTDQGLRLLQRIRDEAHRFAVTYHRNLRTRRMVQSALDQIPGIGKQRKINLLKEFGSLEGIRQAEPDEIQRVTGMNRKQIAILKQYLQDEKNEGSPKDSASSILDVDN